MRENTVHPSTGTGMRAADASSPAATGVGSLPVRWVGVWVGIGLAFAVFAPTLVRVVRTWSDNPEYSHGFLMPFVAAWLLWERKDDIRGLSSGTSLLALPILIFCILLRMAGELEFMNSLSPFAFVGALGGVLLAFVGWRGMGIFFPALVVLWLACPLPGAAQQALTLPLKEISSSFAVGLLQISGIPTYLEGAMIHLEGTDSLWVADACSGIRSFISLLSIAIIACLVWQRHWALKLLVVLAAIPIAIFVNGFRIWLTGWLSVKVSPDAAEGAFHFFEGFALFALAALLLLGFAALLGLLFPKRTA